MCTDAGQRCWLAGWGPRPGGTRLPLGPVSVTRRRLGSRRGPGWVRGTVPFRCCPKGPTRPGRPPNTAPASGHPPWWWFALPTAAAAVCTAATAAAVAVLGRRGVAQRSGATVWCTWARWGPTLAVPRHGGLRLGPAPPPMPASPGSPHRASTAASPRRRCESRPPRSGQAWRRRPCLAPPTTPAAPSTTARGAGVPEGTRWCASRPCAG